MHPELYAALCNQVNLELYSAYIYDTCGHVLRFGHWDGFAKYMSDHALEERNHALRFMHYLEDNDRLCGCVGIPTPPELGSEPVAIFRKVLEHEVLVTDSINALLKIAAQVSDHPTYSFLQSFADEQVEEVADARKNLAQVERASGGHVLVLLDLEFNEE